MENVHTLNEKLQVIHTCSPGEISDLVSASIPQDRLPLQYLEGLSDEDKTICFRASMICWIVTKSAIIPREMQFQAVLANVKGRGAVICAGTGSGKTLPIAIAILLDNPADNLITITLSPFKRLQVTQGTDFNTRFGIPTITINEDTP